MANLVKRIPLLSSAMPEPPFKGLVDGAADAVPANFVRLLGAQFANKLADTLASAKVVLPWIMNSVGAPVFLTGLLVPIRESGSLLPQIVMGGYVRQYAIRKWLTVVGALAQALAVLLIALAAYSLDGVTAGLTIIALLAVLSLSRGLCSLTSKDVLGKAIPKNNRGKLMGLGATLSGLVGIAVGFSVYFDWPNAGNGFFGLLAGAACCWGLTALMYARVAEFEGQEEAAQNAREQIAKSLKLLRSDQPFRRFVMVRTLMMSSGLSAPYFILLAQQSTAGASFENLGLFIITSGIASFVSSQIWGNAADRSSRRVLIITSILTAMLCALGALASYIGSQDLWLMVALFFALNITHQGVRLGRKTYIVDMADGNKRTDYIATSNSAIGVLLLATGVFGALAAQFSMTLVLLLFTLMSLGASLLGRTLPEA
ncbi:MAG: MFS transporter [Gammaproteobacteria bacterium]|nr:MFS transporter [Gammaproteobacteria bacterium]